MQKQDYYTEFFKLGQQKINFGFFQKIQSGKGILNRQIRSTRERHFEDIKENEHFQRFNYRPTKKICKKFMPYAMGRNINKRKETRFFFALKNRVYLAHEKEKNIPTGEPGIKYP